MSIPINQMPSTLPEAEQQKRRLYEQKKSSELLKHVFNADPKNVNWFLSSTYYYEDDKTKIKIEPKDEKETKEKQEQSEGLLNKTLHFLYSPTNFISAVPQGIYNGYQSMAKMLNTPKTVMPESVIVLTRSSVREECQGFREYDWRLKRLWQNISPLEAAAWCGDIFLVNHLLKYVPISKYEEAADQLQGILDRKELAENGEFMAPYKVLIKSYEEYLKGLEKRQKQLKELKIELDRDVEKLKSENETPLMQAMREEYQEKRRHRNYIQLSTMETDLNYTISRPLFHMVWTCQKNLPTYGLQEFTDEKRFNEGFTKEPKRNKNPIGDFGEIPKVFIEKHVYKQEKGYALVKGSSLAYGYFSGNDCEFSRNEVPLDLRAMRQLVDMRTYQLMQIISNLRALSKKEKELPKQRPSS